MKAILIGAVTAATLALPVAALAATYQYVNVNGALETETADNAADALTQPTDRAPDSGVILIPDPAAGIGTTVVTSPTPAMNTVAGTYTDVLTGVNTTARTLYLTLSPDGTVILSSLYADGAPVMIESGTWTGIGNNEVQVTLTGNENESYSPAQTIILNQSGTNLVGSNFSSSVYGTQGLTFVR